MDQRAALMLACWVSLLPATLGQDVPITTLRQTGSFNLPSNPSRISRVASNGGVLWFEVVSGSWSELLSMDEGGGNPNQFALQPLPKQMPWSVGAICASADGRIAVVRAGNKIEIYTRAGELAQTIPIHHPGSACVFDQEVLVWSGTSFEVANGAEEDVEIAPMKLPRMAQLHMLSLSHHRVAVLESSEGILHVLDRQTGKWIDHGLTAPEFEFVRSLPIHENQVVPLFGSPSAAGDNFFVLSNPTNRKVGAKVLRFDSDGDLKGRYLCPLPMGLGNTSVTNPNGYLSPATVIVVDRTLLLLSPSQKTVAVYELN